MTLTPAMEAAERMAGKPLVDAIVDLYVEHRDLGLVADRLGCSRHSLWNWRVRLGIREADLRLAALRADEEARERVLRGKR